MNENDATFLNCLWWWMKELVVNAACVDVKVVILVVKIADDLLEPRGCAVGHWMTWEDDVT